MASRSAVTSRSKKAVEEFTFTSSIPSLSRSRVRGSTLLGMLDCSADRRVLKISWVAEEMVVDVEVGVVMLNVLQDLVLDAEEVELLLLLLLLLLWGLVLGDEVYLIF